MSLGRFDGADAELLSELLDLLSRPIHKDGLLLSDLGALLPTHLRRHAKQRGGLRSWLKSRSMFVIGRQPGKETVALVRDEKPEPKRPQELSAKPIADQSDRATPARAWKPVSSPSPDSTSSASPINASPGGSDLSIMHRCRDGNDKDLTPEQEELEESAVLLRGLPFSTTVEEVRTWLGDHSAHFAEESPIRLVLSHLGRPSGFAHVQLVSPEAARACAKALHLRELGDRYVEVFVFSERPTRSKARDRHSLSLEATPEGGVKEVEAPLGVTPEQVLAEVRAYMSDPSRRVVLLSKLGVALSPGVRAFLKQPDMGLKTFLSQFTEEFLVEGGQGCHQVTLLGAADSGTEGCSGLERTSRNAERLLTSPLPSPQRMREPLSSPSEQRCLRTPSDWGTPLPHGSPEPSIPWPWDWGVHAQVPWYPVLPPLPVPEGILVSTEPQMPVDEPEALSAFVWLNGLPFAATEEDVLAFFAEYDLADRIVDGPHIQQPGEVVVQLRDAKDAAFVQQTLNGQCLDGRFVEVFRNNEEGGDGGIAMGTSSSGFAASAGSRQPDEGMQPFGETGPRPWCFPADAMAGMASWQQTWGSVLGHQLRQDMGDEAFCAERMSADTASKAFWDQQHLLALAQARRSAAAAAVNSVPSSDRSRGRDSSPPRGLQI